MTRKKTGFDNTKLKIRREWLPDAEQLIEKSVKVDEKMQLMALPPIIDGKPFIWTHEDHLDVKAAFEGKKLDEVHAERKKHRDAITDGEEYGNYQPIVVNKDAPELPPTVQQIRELDIQQRKDDLVNRKAAS